MSSACVSTTLAIQRHDLKVDHKACEYFHNTVDSVLRVVAACHPRPIKTDDQVDGVIFSNRWVCVTVDTTDNVSCIVEHPCHDKLVCVTNDVCMLGEGSVCQWLHVKEAAQLDQPSMANTHVHRCSYCLSQNDERRIPCS